MSWDDYTVSSYPFKLGFIYVNSFTLTHSVTDQVITHSIVKYTFNDAEEENEFK